MIDVTLSKLNVNDIHSESVLDLSFDFSCSAQITNFSAEDSESGFLKFDARRRTDPQLLEAILSPNYVL